MVNETISGHTLIQIAAGLANLACHEPRELARHMAPVFRLGWKA